MDIKCRICGEPWDTDSLHEAISERFPENRNACTIDGKFNQEAYEQSYFNPMVADFRQRGCNALSVVPTTWCQPDELTPQRSAVTAAMHDLMGEDLDGIASMTEDAMEMGLL